MESPTEFQFKKIEDFSCQYASATAITQYESLRTGMKVVVVDRPGPMVRGRFALATEINDDSGAPHTLEHLCFTGSRSYHYSGLLDILANRAFSVTNAWTDVDHTCYELDSAGWEAFAQILPVYLEHLLLPTITDSACLTEVWHITGDGSDAGVVYSEMQGDQNSSYELMALRAKRLMFPEGNGYRSETGGLMERLRVLSPDRIRQFHRAMYQPRNLCLIVIGHIEHGNLLRSLYNFEGSILKDVPDVQAPFTRPWVDSNMTIPLERSCIETVEFPDDDESVGDVTVTFLGPRVTDHLQATAIDVMIKFLSGSSASVLDNVLIEKEQLASGVYCSTKGAVELIITIAINGIASRKLKAVESRLFTLLGETASKELDMRFMHDCIGLCKRETEFDAETSADAFTFPIIMDFVYGTRNGVSLQRSLGDLEDFDTLNGWTEVEWRQFLSTWFSDAKHVSVLGQPSAVMAKKLTADEEQRLQARREELGADGLKAMAKKLIAAKAEIAEVPPEVLKEFEPPLLNTISFIETVSAQSGPTADSITFNNPIQSLIKNEDAHLPLFIHFEHIPSAFAHISILVSTEEVPIELKPMLSVFMELFFASPLLRDGQRLDFEQVIKELQRDTVGFTFSLGNNLGVSELLSIQIQVKSQNYSIAIEWLKELMCSSIVDVERIETTVNRLLSEIPGEKRSGDSMMTAVNEMSLAAPSSTVRARSALSQALYLKHVRSMLRQNPEQVVDQIQTIKKALWQTANFRTLVASDIEKLARPVSTWQSFSEALQSQRLLNPLETRLSRLNDLGRDPSRTSYIVPMHAIDSAFAMSTTKGPSSYEDTSLPALKVAIEFLNQAEGPLWNAVRGNGLAYGAGVSHKMNSGQIALDLYRTPDAYKAYNACKQVIEGFALGTKPIDSSVLQSAISAIALGLAGSEDTVISAAEGSFVRQVVRGSGKDWPQKLLEKVQKVTAEEVRKVLESLVLPLFDYESSVLVVTCASTMEEGLVKRFRKSGLRPEVRSLADFQDSYGFDVDLQDLTDEEDEDDEDEDEDEEEGEGEDEGED